MMPSHENFHPISSSGPRERKTCSEMEESNAKRNIFQTVKAAVPVPQAAEAYGLTLTRNHLTCCPFHPDRHPSMKLNRAYYYCFGCHETGDVIDFTAKLFHLTPVQAALKLAADFGIDPNTPAAACATYPRAAPAQQHKRHPRGA